VVKKLNLLNCTQWVNPIYKITVLYPDLKLEFDPLVPLYENLGGKIFNFITYVEKNWK
jgi:hypothetical protein